MLHAADKRGFTVCELKLKTRWLIEKVNRFTRTRNTQLNHRPRRLHDERRNDSAWLILKLIKPTTCNCFLLSDRCTVINLNKPWPTFDTIKCYEQTQIYTQLSFSPCAIDPVHTINCMTHNRLCGAARTTLLISAAVIITGLPIVITLRDTETN